MAYVGIWVILLVLLFCLAAIIMLLHKGKGKWALGLGVFLIIAIPIWLDQIILRQWYLVIPIESARKPDEWMDFLGSYLGVAGTVVVGALAYWQTRVNREQDKAIEGQRQDIENQNQEIRRLQAQIAAYQIRPSVNFRDGVLKVYSGNRRQETNKKEYSKIYYSLIGEKPSESLLSFIYIKIPFREKGLVPIEKICIVRMEWNIAGRTYSIAPAKVKYALVNEEVQILVDSDDKITEPGIEGNDVQRFMDKALTHQENSFIGRYNYDQSQFVIMIKFINQIEKDRIYRLDYFIHNDGEGEKLHLAEPHVSIIGENNGNNNGTIE